MSSTSSTDSYLRRREIDTRTNRTVCSIPVGFEWVRSDTYDPPNEYCNSDELCRESYVEHDDSRPVISRGMLG